MAGLNSILKDIGKGESIRDFRHASKIFVDNNYELLPKPAFIFYVYFNINPQANVSFAPNVLKKIEAGVLAKAVDLPKYRIDFKTHNAYNRKDNVQTKINYEPIQLVLHDDSANVIRDLWQSYMRHYYRDADYSINSSYGANNYQQNKYTTRPTDVWGYSPVAANSVDFFTSIQIYSMSKKRYSLYELVHPKIESFEHGRHDSTATTTLLENTMRINYEAVNYSEGDVFEGSIIGFNDRYDNQPSPLTPFGGGTRSISGQGGLIDTASSIGSALGRGNLLEAGFLALRGARNLKGFDFKKAAESEANEAIGEVIRGVANSGKPYQFPRPTGVVQAGQQAIQSGVQAIGSIGLASSNGEDVVQSYTQQQLDALSNIRIF